MHSAPNIGEVLGAMRGFRFGAYLGPSISFPTVRDHKLGDVLT
jgi:hypothetical protein